MTLSVVVLNRSLDVRPVCHCSIRQVGCVGAKFTVVVGQLASSTRGPTPLRRQDSAEAVMQYPLITKKIMTAK